MNMIMNLKNGERVEPISTAQEEEKVMQPTYEMLECARRQGYQEGFRAGESNGIMRGIEEGVYREKMNTAYRMILQGENNERILAYTEITKEEVEDFIE